MSSTTQERAQDILQDSTAVIQELMEEGIKLADENQELRRKLEEQSALMSQKLAEANKVVLEKVAKAKTEIYDAREVRDLVEGLKAAGYIVTDQEARDVAKAIKDDPNQLLKVASDILTLSTPAPTSGTGVQKTAGTTSRASRQGLSPEWEEDGWLDIVESGEC